MYGPKQAAVLDFRQLAIRLQVTGYSQIIGSSRIWNYEIRGTVIYLSVDDFSVKYFNTEDANHLLSTLGIHYKYTVDWAGHKFCGLIFDWYYNDSYYNVSIPGYINIHYVYSSINQANFQNTHHMNIF